MEGVPQGTQAHDSLRLRIQGREFKDFEWADTREIFKLCQELCVTVGIVDTRYPDLGFRYYYSEGSTNQEARNIESLPRRDNIVKLAFTGNHYLSVTDEGVKERPEAASAAVGTVATTAQAVTVTITSEQVELLRTLQSFETQTITLDQIQVQLQQCSFLKEDIKACNKWMKTVTAKVTQLESGMAKASQLLGKDPQTQNEQGYINQRPKLLSYQQRLQRELCCFISCYFLAPAGILKLEDDKKDTAISMMSEIPIAGSFLKILTKGLSHINKKYRHLQMNRLNELFISLDHITKECVVFARQITLVKETTIEQQVDIKYEGFDKVKELYQTLKDTFEKLWKGLVTSDKTGVTLCAQDKLAVLDAAFLLQQILSEEVKIDKEQSLSAQFITVLTGQTYQPRQFAAVAPVLLDANAAAVAVAPAVPSPTNPQSNSGFDLQKAFEKMQAQFLQMYQAQQQELERVKAELAEAKRTQERQAEIEKERQAMLAQFQQQQKSQSPAKQTDVDRLSAKLAEVERSQQGQANPHTIETLKRELAAIKKLIAGGGGDSSEIQILQGGAQGSGNSEAMVEVYQMLQRMDAQILVLTQTAGKLVAHTRVDVSDIDHPMTNSSANSHTFTALAKADEERAKAARSAKDDEIARTQKASMFDMAAAARLSTAQSSTPGR